jgi:hypothetical protein
LDDTVIVNTPFDVEVVFGYYDGSTLVRDFGASLPIRLIANQPGVEFPTGVDYWMEDGLFTCQAIARYTSDGAVLDQGPLVITAMLSPSVFWSDDDTWTVDDFEGDEPIDVEWEEEYAVMGSAETVVVDAVIDQPDGLSAFDNANDHAEYIVLEWDYSDNHPGHPNGTTSDQMSNTVDYYQIYREFLAYELDALEHSEDPDFANGGTADPPSSSFRVMNIPNSNGDPGGGWDYDPLDPDKTVAYGLPLLYDVDLGASSRKAVVKLTLYKDDFTEMQPFVMDIYVNAKWSRSVPMYNEVTETEFVVRADNNGHVLLQLGADDNTLLAKDVVYLETGNPEGGTGAPEQYALVGTNGGGPQYGVVSTVEVWSADLTSEVFHWGTVPATDPADIPDLPAPDMIRVVVPTAGDASLSGWYVKAEDVDRTSNRGTVHKVASTSASEMLEDGSIRLSLLGMPSQVARSVVSDAVGPVYALAIDNLAPSAPRQVTVHATERSAEVAWKLSEDDRVVARGLTVTGRFWEILGVREYRIYRKLSHQSDEHYTLQGVAGAGTSSFEDKSSLNRHLTYDYRVVAYDGTNFSEVALAQSVRVVPERFALSQNRPNPFNPTTVIEYALPEAGAVLLEIYSLTGQKVLTLVDASLEAGYHTAVWDAVDASGRDVASGIYVYRIVTPSGRAVRKMVLTR